MSGPRAGRRRVLLLVENAPVPQDRRVWNQATTLVQAGWEVTVLAPLQQRAAQPATERIDGVDVHRFPLRASGGGVLGWLREYAEAMWKLRRGIRRLAADAPFDVIHAANPPDFLLAAALGQRRRGAALVFDQHDLVPEMLEERFGRRTPLLWPLLIAVERLAHRMADVTLAMNDSFREVALGRGGCASEDVVVVRNGPRLERFVRVPADRTLAGGAAHLLVFVGLMNPTDGVDHALHALAALARHRDDWRAVFLGDGESFAELRDLAGRLGVAGRVDFPGFVDDHTLRTAICAADVCLAPDPRSPLTERSTLVKIAEYMAMGRPIVSYGLAETRVTAGAAAAYAARDDPEAFAAAIAELLDDPDRRARMGALARERIERRFAWEYSEAAMLQAYERALGKAAARRRRAAAPVALAATPPQ